MAELQADDKPLKTYRGNCHCGAFVFEVQLPEITSAMECNCSICSKKAYDWVFPAKREHYKVVKGQESDLTVYSFGPKTLQHLFCPTCGTGVIARRSNNTDPEALGAGINARAIQGLTSWKLTKTPYDGAATGDKYEPPAYTGPEPEAEVEGGKIYTGSCHCGAVTVALKSKPLEELDMVCECSCSICQRHGYKWIYPEGTQLAIQGADNLTKYRFGEKHLDKTFCKTCGVQITNDWRKDMSEEEVAAMSPGKRGFFQASGHYRPFNIRVLDGVDIGGLKTTQSDVAAGIGMEYANP